MSFILSLFWAAARFEKQTGEYLQNCSNIPVPVGLVEIDPVCTMYPIPFERARESSLTNPVIKNQKQSCKL